MDNTHSSAAAMKDPATARSGKSEAKDDNFVTTYLRKYLDDTYVIKKFAENYIQHDLLDMEGLLNHLPPKTAQKFVDAKSSFEDCVRHADSVIVALKAVLDETDAPKKCPEGNTLHALRSLPPGVAKKMIDMNFSWEDVKRHSQSLLAIPIAALEEALAAEKDDDNNTGGGLIQAENQEGAPKGGEELAGGKSA